MCSVWHWISCSEHMKLTRRLTLLLMLACPSVHAETVLVVNARSPIEKITHEEIINVYMGRYRRLPSGVITQPIDQAEGPERTDFYRRLVNKSVPEINAYWARLIFSGKSSPPDVAASSKDLTKILTSNLNAIGYLDRKDVDGRMRIIFEFRD